MTIRNLLNRSDDLEDAVVMPLGGETDRPVPVPVRASASAMAAGVSLKHSRAVRVLIASSLPSSAVALMRLKFEMVTRAV